ncbi:hypothetical protein [Streptomyces sp. HUAS TT20]|uniref:hypothetical protein n=1 Tax=Streptomyces sp. HUAS TT20 TaxID=3447509 RepID=UPI0021DB5248|nr:hypothetical protein [Streptomyces sp. HUAS 15-9]UXY33109.1 hypothetical protein N8I87_43170 [Streptomyces sp. HUAS 15-9]
MGAAGDGGVADGARLGPSSWSQSVHVGGGGGDGTAVPPADDDAGLGEGTWAVPDKDGDVVVGDASGVPAEGLVSGL